MAHQRRQGAAGGGRTRTPLHVRCGGRPPTTRRRRRCPRGRLAQIAENLFSPHDQHRRQHPCNELRAEGVQLPRGRPLEDLPQALEGCRTPQTSASSSSDATYWRLADRRAASAGTKSPERTPARAGLIGTMPTESTSCWGGRKEGHQGGQPRSLSTAPPTSSLVSFVCSRQRRRPPVWPAPPDFGHASAPAAAVQESWSSCEGKGATGTFTGEAVGGQERVACERGQNPCGLSLQGRG